MKAIEEIENTSDENEKDLDTEILDMLIALWSQTFIFGPVTSTTTMSLSKSAIFAPFDLLTLEVTTVLFL